MNAVQENSCIDCLHCKVSATSTKNCKMCFCSETKKKVWHKIAHWEEKKVCKKFVDLSKDELPRLPLLKKKV
jgi:hypothetical protein